MKIEVYHFETGEIKTFNEVDYFKTRQYRTHKILKNCGDVMFKIQGSRGPAKVEQTFKSFSAANTKAKELTDQGFMVTIRSEKLEGV